MNRTPGRQAARETGWMGQWASGLLGGVVIGVLISGPVAAEPPTQPTPLAQPLKPDRTIQIFAALVANPEQLAHNRAVIVEVKIQGLPLREPAEPERTSGHLQYRLDQGPIIATTATRLGLQGLSPGPHVVTVQLVRNDQTRVGPEQVLTVTVP